MSSSNDQIGNCTVVTVTYGDRIALLSQVIQRLMDIGVGSLIVVGNQVSEASRSALRELAKQGKILYLDQEQNLGSAGGYHLGIKKALENFPDSFIWLLDDDNLPQPNALQVLFDAWTTLECGPLDALASYRPDRKIYLDAVRRQDPERVLGKKDAFLGFHVSDLWSKLNQPKGVASFAESDSLPKPGLLAAAPYGGLFFSTALLNQVDLPDPKWVFYVDDFQFTHPIYLKGGNIYLVPASQIKDLETSFHLKKDKKFSIKYFRADSDFKIFHSVRNAIWFEQQFRLRTKGVYWVNMVLYLILAGFSCLFNPENLKKWPPFYRGIREGLKGP